MGRSVFIAGAGPCGLAAALAFHQAGWEKITVVEPSASARAFDKNKGFNYLIDARGQRLLSQLGLMERMPEYGVENRRNIMTIVMPDGSKKIFKSPFWDPKRDSSFWSRRERLQALLQDRIDELTDGRISILYGHAFEDVRLQPDGQAMILFAPVGEDGASAEIKADLLLGCDGLRSTVRHAMIRHSGRPKAAFERIKFPSPASQLNYKVLSMPSQVPLALGEGAADDHKMAYAFVARHNDPQKAMAMVAYPVADSKEPRTVNIIRLPDHQVWAIDDAAALRDFLIDSFPQLPIDAVLPSEELDDFVAVKASRFPAPQYTKSISAVVGDNNLPVLLLGDAAHAFPPDLGLGVNTALQDVYLLMQTLEKNRILTEAVATFDKAQEPERKALAKLVQTVAPYQYNQNPSALKRWALKFFLVKALHKALPFLVDMPAVLLAQQDALAFSEIRARQVRNRWKIGGLFAALAGGGLFALL